MFSGNETEEDDFSNDFPFFFLTSVEPFILVSMGYLAQLSMEEDLGFISSILAEVERNNPVVNTLGKRLDELVSKDIPNYELLLRNLGASDDQLNAFQCNVGFCWITNPVKLKGENNLWFYFEKAVLLQTIANDKNKINPETKQPFNVGFNPVTRLPIHPNEPLDAPELIVKEMKLIISKIQEGLEHLGASEEEIKAFHLQDNANLPAAEFVNKLITFIKSLHEKISLELTEADKKFDCPLTGKMIYDPIKIKEGKCWIYVERSAWENALNANPNINPVTKADLIENVQVLDAPEYTQDLWAYITTLDLKNKNFQVRFAEKNKSPLRKKPCANTFMTTLLDEIEAITANPAQKSDERSAFRQALEVLAANLNIELLNEETRLIAENENAAHYDFSAIKHTSSGRYAQYTIDMLHHINNQNDENAKDKFAMLREYKNKCMLITAENNKLLKLISRVCSVGLKYIVMLFAGENAGLDSANRMKKDVLAFGALVGSELSMFKLPPSIEGVFQQGKRINLKK